MSNKDRYRDRYQLHDHLVDDAFWDAYVFTSSVGQSDAPGSVEFHRVRSEWIAAGRPLPAAPFIRMRANIGPYPEGGA